jgi:hypothetical protein
MTHGQRRGGHGHGAPLGFGGLLGLLLAGMVAERQAYPGTGIEGGHRSPGPTRSPLPVRGEAHGHSDGMRASDAERAAVVSALSRHLADGRIDMAELDERIGRAMAATTRAELASLQADLPSLIPDRSPIPRSPLRRWATGALWAIGLVVGLVALIVVVVALG